MLTITDLKVGTIINWNSAPHEVVFAQHSKLGRGGAIMRTKLRNLVNGATVENTFKGNDRLEAADLSYKEAQYLYKNDTPPAGELVFMDNTTFEQVELPSSLLGDKINFLKEGSDVDLVIINGKPSAIRIPIKVDLQVTYTEPGFKGDTQSAALKPAILETGAQIQVPLFIKTGDLIRVDTRTGTYVERVN